jgi:hypothetical protein
MSGTQVALLQPTPAQNASMALGLNPQPYVAPRPPAVPAKPAAAPAAPASTSALPSFAPLVQAASLKTGLRPTLISAVARVESGGDPNAVSPKGAIGVMQLEPGTASDVGVDPTKPGPNIMGGSVYLSQMIQRYGGDETKGLMAYNWGPNNVDNWIKYGADPSKVPPSVMAYVQNVKAAEGGSSTDPLTGQYQSLIAANDASFAQGQAAQAPIIAQMMQSLSQDKARFDKIADSYTPYQPPPPPTPPVNDPLKGFGSAAAIFAAIASAFTRTPATAALNGMAAAMNAAKQNDFQAYQANYQRWQDATANMLAQHKLQAQDMQEALDKMQTDLSTGLAMAKAVAAQSQDQIAQRLADEGDIEKLYQLQTARMTAADNLQKNANAMQEQAPKLFASNALAGAQQRLAAAQQSRDPAAIASAQTAYNQALAMYQQINSPASAIEKPGTPAAMVNAIYTQLSAQHPDWPPDKLWETANSLFKQSGQAPGSQFEQPVVATIKGKDGAVISALVQQDKDSGQWVTADQNRSPVAGTVVSTHSSSSPVSGDDPGVQAIAKAVSNYSLAPYQGYNATTPFGQAVMEQVFKTNPSYNATEYEARSRAVAAFSTGKQGQAVNSFNVAVYHLDTLSKLADALANGDARGINRLSNEISAQTGSSAVTNFNAAKQVVADELNKAILGSGGGEGERQDTDAKINAASSPAQLKGIIDTYKQLMVGQLVGLRQQYQVDTGLNDFDTKLSPQTLSILKSEGSPSQPSAQSGGPSPTGATPQAPAIGTVQQGYRYKGGDPSQPSSWVKVNG